MNLVDLTKKAQQRIRGRIRCTELTESLVLSRRTGATVYLKHEENQRTGSFKVRGALNSILTLQEQGDLREVVTASTGNHGKAVIDVARELNIRVTVFLSSSTSLSKVSMLRNLGAAVEFAEGDCMTAETVARNYSQLNQIPYISPYNDLCVIAGQGTLGMELQDQLNRAPDTVYIAVGGGGLISGAGSYLRDVCPLVKIIGCWPKNAPALYENLKAGHIFYVSEKDTLSTSTAGNIEPGSVTFDICKAVISESVLITESQIQEAITLLREKENITVEGAAGVAVAGLLRQASEGVLLPGALVVVVLCGGNV